MIYSLCVRCWFLALLTVVAGCDGTIRRVDSVPEPPPGLGSLQVTSSAMEAEVYIDGKYHGQLKGYWDGLIALPEGERRVEIRCAGYYTQYFVVQIGQDAIRIDAPLVEIPAFDSELPASKTAPRGIE